MQGPDIKNLTSSWTKYDSVKVIEITLAGELEKALKEQVAINVPVLRNYLGIHSTSDPLPGYWKEIQKYPRQLGPFALMAAVFTHYEVIGWFAHEFSQIDTSGTGTLLMRPNDKSFTNLRSALVVSKAADAIFRRKKEVPYDLSPLFGEGKVGLLMKELLSERLRRIGHSEQAVRNDFLALCNQYDFPAVFSLTEEEFAYWIGGNSTDNVLNDLEKIGITYAQHGRIRAIKIKQWLQDWENVPSYGEKNRRKPPPYFYIFNIPALLLRRIYEVHSRQASIGRTDESNIQRKHSSQRINEIREFVRGGYPWSTISREQRKSEAYNNLQMPGWLPTSIIANILASGSERNQKTISPEDVIRIEEVDDNFVDIVLPRKIWTDQWSPLVLPVEIIDGQHRIKAFDNIQQLKGNYEFPIVAFDNLDFTWQAYLFYTINIKPKRINTSLAYDLMPLLRIQDWLEYDLDGPDIYKKVRAQELTELLWSVPESPWYDRINMLGDTGANKGGPVSQNAFVSALINSFVKKWDGKIGGLFGGELHEGEQDVIQWDKETQAAFLIFIWKAISKAVGRSKAEWVKVLKNKSNGDRHREIAKAFLHSQSFFSTDQGVRAVLNVFNDMAFVANDLIGLNAFSADIDYEGFTPLEVIEHIVESFRDNRPINDFINAVAKEIVDGFDWRTPAAFDMTDPDDDELRLRQSAFRGSGGYREMRAQLVRILTKSNKIVGTGNGDLEVSRIARTVQEKLGL